jgi:hypothetical protein
VSVCGSGHAPTGIAACLTDPSLARHWVHDSVAPCARSGRRDGHTFPQHSASASTFGPGAKARRVASKNGCTQRAPHPPACTLRSSPGTSRSAGPPRRSARAPRAGARRHQHPHHPPAEDPRTRAGRRSCRPAVPQRCMCSVRSTKRGAPRLCLCSVSSSARRPRPRSHRTSPGRSLPVCRQRWPGRRRSAGLQSCRTPRTRTARCSTPPACHSSSGSGSRRAGRRPAGSRGTSRGRCPPAARPRCPAPRRPEHRRLIRPPRTKRAPAARLRRQRGRHAGWP